MRHNHPRLYLFGRATAVAMTALALSSMVAPPPVVAAEIIGARIGRHPDMTRLVIDLGADADYRIRYEDGHRIVVTLTGDQDLPAIASPAAAGLIWKISVLDGSKRELAIDLAGPAEVIRAFTLSPETERDATFRIVLDLREVPRADWARLVATGGTRPATPGIANVTAATPQQREAPEPEPEPGPAPATPAAPLDAHQALRGGLFDGLSIDGYVEIEGRVFTEKSEDPAPPERLSASVALEPTISYAWNNGRSLVSFTPFARLDSNDGERSHVDIREAKWVQAFDRLEARIGIDKVFWGVTESQHLVDIINQDDMLEDIDGEDKLGQPMIALSYDSDLGLLSAYAMTYFRERRFPGRDGRPRGPFPIAYDLIQYEADSDKWHFDWALRWSHVMGPFDIALSHFHGTNRDPRLILGQDDQGAPILIPRYELIDQTGIEVQATFGALLLKAEAIRRAQPGENQHAAIGGLEYTAYQIFGGASDLGFLAEYLWDERSRPTDNPFEDDLFLALRWTANDIASTTILAGTILDLDTSAKFVTIEASRRLSGFWRVSLDARLFLSTPLDDPLFFYRDDSFLQLKLQRFF